jgi:hypothetical protein
MLAPRPSGELAAASPIAAIAATTMSLVLLLAA